MTALDTADAPSDADASTPDPPDPPEGYGDPVRFTYPSVALAVGSLVLFLLAFAGFSELMTALRPEAAVEYTVGPAGMAAFTLVLTPLLAGPLPVAIAAFLVLVVNTGGAIGDLYIAWRVLRMPEGTLLYDVDARHSYVFYPE